MFCKNHVRLLKTHLGRGDPDCKLSQAFGVSEPQKSEKKAAISQTVEGGEEQGGREEEEGERQEGGEPKLFTIDKAPVAEKRKVSILLLISPRKFSFCGTIIR